MISIDEARKALNDGKIIVYPTDTVWGMGCDPFDQKAIDNLFTVKGKKLDGLSIMFSHKKGIYDSCEINKKAKKNNRRIFARPYNSNTKIKKRIRKRSY